MIFIECGANISPGGSGEDQTTADGRLHTQVGLHSGSDSVLVLEGKDTLVWIEREEDAS